MYIVFNRKIAAIFPLPWDAGDERGAGERDLSDV